MLEFLLGLPYLKDGVLLRTARRLKAPVLISANALSIWERDAVGLRHWRGFDRSTLNLVAQHPVALDSGGFVASVLYRGFNFSVPQYMDLCAAAPWQWFASLDMTCEPEIAGDEEVVRDRIAGTVRLNRECLREARERGIADRFVPVIQGHRVEHYLRCLDQMPDLSSFPLIGIGSMCRRHVEDDELGILRIVDELDRAFRGTRCRFHLFGIKTTGMSELRQHPRVRSVDSQAWGLHARISARKAGISKTNAYLAGVMERWYSEQKRLLAQPGYAFRAPVAPLRFRDLPEPASPFEARLREAAEELRELHQDGEIEWTDLSPLRLLEYIGLDEPELDGTDELALADAA